MFRRISLLVGLVATLAVSTASTANAYIFGPTVDSTVPHVFTLGDIRAHPTLFGRFGWGQSLDACVSGAIAGVPITPVARSVTHYADETFGSGVKSMAPDNHFSVGGVGPPLFQAEPSGPGTTTIDPGTTTWISLREDTNYAWADPTTTMAGETSITSSLDMLHGLVEGWASGFAPPTLKWFGSTPARGGEQIANLLPGSTGDWLNLRQHLAAFVGVAKAQGLRPAVPNIFWTQGQADAVLGTSYATYYADETLIFQGFNTEVAAQFAAQGYSQTAPVVTLINQISHKSESGGGPIARAQFDWAKDHPTQAHMLPPDVLYPHAGDSLHLTASGCSLRGVYEGRALFALNFQTGLAAITTLYADSATYITATGHIRLHFQVPTKPLRIATDNILVGQAAWAATFQKGLRAFDDSGDITLSSIQVMPDGETLDMVASRAPTTNPLFDVGLDYHSASNPLASIGNANTDLKDSTPGTFTPQGTSEVYNTWYWPSSCQLTLQVA